MTPDAPRTEFAIREWAKNAVRGVKAVPIRNTEYVPRFKRRVDACIDRAEVLLRLEHEQLPEAATPADSLDALRALISDGIEAIRITREYVGDYTLPAAAGWSWFDWTERARATLRAGQRSPRNDEPEEGWRA